jgi:protein TonB
MIMTCFHRTLLFSLFLHAATIFFFMNYLPTDIKQKPVIVELSLTGLPAGMAGGKTEKPANKGNKTTPVAGKLSAPPKTARQDAALQVRPPTEKAFSKKLPEKVVQPAPRPVQTPQVVHEQHETSGESKVVSEKQTTSGIQTASSTGSGSGKSGQAGGAAQGNGKSGGTGSGGSSGNGSGNSPEQLKSKYLSENFAYIKDIIQKRLAYPAKARREGLTGKARVSFVILENGQVANIKILNSTGYEILDLNLIETIKEVAPFPKPPIKAELRVPIFYRLEQ